jgi:hypothetical protein
LYVTIIAAHDKICSAFDIILEFSESIDQGILRPGFTIEFRIEACPQNDNVIFFDLRITIFEFFSRRLISLWLRFADL